MASHDETLDPNAPQPPRRPTRPANPAGETAPPDTRVQRQHARDEQRVAHPKLFGSYRILGILGQGGMGVVYTAEQQHPKRRVALKVIRPMLGTRDMIKRFRLEADVLGRLEHPGIARIYEAGSADAGAGPQPFFAMELVKGQSLEQYVGPGKLALRDKLELIARIADAVHFAHEHGVIHRDLKPSNILVEETGQPKILDFGVARVTDSDVQSATMQTDSGSLVGTVQYMSPEQASGIHREIDARSDVYALGLIAYEILAGKYPFDLGNSGLFEALRIVREQDVPALSSHDRQLRGDVETIVHKAVEKEKSRRYASAAEFASDIRKHLAHRPISARPRSFGYVASRYLRRNRVLVGSFVAAALVIALGIAWMTSGQQATSARRVNELTRQFDQQLARGDWSSEATGALRQTIDDIAALSPADAAGANERFDRSLGQHVATLLSQKTLPEDEIKRQIAALARGRADVEREWMDRLAKRKFQPVVVLALSPSAATGAGPATAERFQAAADGKALRFAAPKVYRPGATLVPLGVACGKTTIARLELPETWETGLAQVGFAFVPTGGASAVIATRPASQPASVEDRAVDGYTLQADVEYLDPAGQIPSAAARTMAAAREAREGANVVLTIRRRTRVLREVKYGVQHLQPGKVELKATLDGGKLSLTFGTLSTIEAYDTFPPPITRLGVAVKLPDKAAVSRLEVERLPLPQTPHPLDAADERFAAASYGEALPLYESVAHGGDYGDEVRQEAQFKLGVTLARVGRDEEAYAALHKLFAEPGDRWPATAGGTLWLLYLEKDRRPQAQAVLDTLTARYPMPVLAKNLPDDMRRTLLGIYINEFNSVNLLRRPDPANVARLKQAADLPALLDPEISRLFLIRAYESLEQFDDAVAVAERMLDENLNLFSWRPPLLIQSYSTLMRMRNQPQPALDAVHGLLLDREGNARPQFWAMMIERARLLEHMGDFEGAERDLEMFLKFRQDRVSYANLADASLMLGFLRARRGDTAGAREAWRAGLYREHVKRAERLSDAARRAAVSLATADSQTALALGCLADDISDAEINDLGLLGSFSNNEGFDFLRRGGYQVPASTVRATFADPRGREWAHRFALRADPPPQALRTLLAHMLREFLGEATVGPNPTPEQDATLARAADGMRRMYEYGKANPAQLLQFAVAWKGASGALGWGGLYDALEPDVRGPLGEVMAMRYEKLGLAEAAVALRAQAQKDLAANPMPVPATMPANTAPAPTTTLSNVKVDVPEVRPPGSARVPKVAATPRSPATKPAAVANAAPPPAEKPAAPAAIPPAPSAASADAKLYEELKQANAQAYRLRRDGKLTDAADLRRSVVERANTAWPASDERVISFTMDYVELLLELKRFDEADELVRPAQANAGASGPAADRVKSVTGRLQRARGAAVAAATAPSATRPAATAPLAPPAPQPQVNPLDAELKFVGDAINARQYREAEARLLEMYVAAMSGDVEPARHRAITLGLARVYDAWGKPADAKLFRDRADAAAAPASRPVAGEPDPRKLEWIDAMNRQAFSLRQQSRLNLAETLRSRVVTEIKALLPAGDRRVIAYQIDYIDLLLQMQKYDEAERQLLDANKATTDPSHPQAATIRRALIRLYDAWGKPERARAIQNQPTTQPRN